MRNQREIDRHYWMLKTTAGSHGPSHWPEFLAAHVVAVGWAWINVDPSTVRDRTELRRRITRLKPKLPAGQHAYIARIVYTFANDWNVGDKAIICRGYSSTQTANVHLYGVAEVGKFLYRPHSDWWAFQRRASIQRIEQDIPKRIFVDALNLETSRQTIHRITREEFEDFEQRVKAYLAA